MNTTTLSASEVTETVERSGLSRLEFAEKVGCGTSQLFKYQKEGLPPRMDRQVKANILRLAMEAGVLPANAGRRATVSKLEKSQR